MKSNYLRRSMALAVSAAMVLSSAPVSFASAEEIQEDVVAVLDDSAESLAAVEEAEEVSGEVLDEAQVEILDEAGAEPSLETVPLEEAQAPAVEVPAEETQAPAEEPEPELLADGLEVEAVEYVDTAEVEELSLDADVTPQKPGQVQNLRIDEENKSLICWNNDDAADYYEISVTDSKGQVYCKDYSSAVYPTAYGLSSDLSDTYYYIYLTDPATGTLTRAKDAEGYHFDSVELNAGEAYAVAVRGVNEYYDSVSEEYLYAYGDWSVPITYMIPAVTPEKVTNLKLEDGMLTWNQGQGVAEMEVTDAEGYGYYSYTYSDLGTLYCRYGSAYSGMELPEDASTLYQYKVGDGGTLQRTTVADPADPDGWNYVKAFQVGSTYTIRIRTTNGESGSKRVASEWSDPLTYTVAEKTVPEKTGNLSYENGELSWNRVKNVSGYELQVVDANGLEYLDADAEWDSAAQKNVPGYFHTGSAYLEVYDRGSDLTAADAAGNVVTAFRADQIYTVRVRGYNYNSKNEEQFAEWSDAYSFAISLTPAPGKVTGVAVQDDSLIWNSLQSVDGYSADYEIRVYDITETGEPRFYGTGMSNDEIIYWSTGNTSVSMIDRYYEDDEEYYTYAPTLYTYVKVDGSWVSAKHPQTGKPIIAFEKGQTYYLNVRGVRTVNNEKKYGEWSDPVAYIRPADPRGINAAPAKVTGVTLRTSSKADERNLSGATLSWNYVENVDYYELLVKDSAGHEFADGYKRDDMKNGILTPVYLAVEDESYYPNIVLNAKELKSYVKAEGSAVDTVKDAAGKDLTAFLPGETYTLQIRAVNTYQEWDAAAGGYGKEQTFAGEWSDPVTYTAGTLVPITDLSYVESDEDYYYFTYSAGLANSDLYYQIATNADFSAAALLNGSTWRRANTSENKLAIAKESLEPGKTYYLRAVNSQYAPKENEVFTVAPAVVAIIAEAEAAPKNITGLRLYETRKSSFEFRFDAVLEEDDSFELQYNTSAADAPEGAWVIGSTNSTLNYASLNEGTYYVRAVAYVTRTDKEGRKTKVYGTPSNVVGVVVSRAASAISGLKLEEKTPYGYAFSYTGTLRKNEEIQYWYSESSSFASDRTKTVIDYDYGSEPNRFGISYTELTPGVTYYVRARVYNSSAAKEADQYSAFTNVVKVKAAMPKISVSGSDITSTSITLRMSAVSNDEYLTGYQVQKKVGKKYTTLGKTTDSIYKSTGLAKDTEYTYRVRPYYVNGITGKTTYGSWEYYAATTWGSALNLKAKAASQTTVKLSWTKVSGAEGYEVYRRVANSAATKVTDNRANDYTKYVLLKTITKEATVSYTDKDLDSNLAYKYRVRAYKTVNGKKYYIESLAEVDLGFGSFTFTDVFRYTNGKVKVTWSPCYSADGYLVEKQNVDTGAWTKVKTLKASASSYTISKTTSNKGKPYRIRAYKGSEYSNAATVTVWPYVPAPTGVAAKANNKDGSITVSWKAVSGADYYRVYRTTSSWKMYDETQGAYYYTGGKQVPVYVADSTKTSGWRLVTETKDLTATKVVDRPITYTYNGATNTVYAGPTPGVKYYYYVIAYKNGKPYNYVEDYYEGGMIASPNSKAASATVTGITAPKPTLSKPAVGQGKITVKWKKLAKAEGYEVYRSTKKNSGYKKLSTIAKNTTVSYADTNVASGKTYYYKVRSYRTNEAGVKVYSSYSAVKTVKAAKVTIKLSKPTIQTPAAAAGKVTVKWKKVSGATGYVVYRSTKKSSGYKKLATVAKSTATSYVDKTVKAKATYYYKIRAYKTVGATTGYSAYSTVKQIKAK